MTDFLREWIGRVFVGDCADFMASLPDNCVDAVVTDPPYGLEFMGKEWDKLWDSRDGSKGSIGQWKGRDGSNRKPGASGYAGFLRLGVPARIVAGKQAQLWHFAWATQALRVLKPGGHLLAFGGARTYHRMACAVEDAGFEIRDQIMWVYGSGFPKSLDVSKAIDKAAGAKRNQVGCYRVGGNALTPTSKKHGTYSVGAPNANAGYLPITKPATNAAIKWDGWGTGLKPAHEPIVVARKPLSEPTVAANVLKWGTGALNVDACRVSIAADERPTIDNRSGGQVAGGVWQGPGKAREIGERFTSSAHGRWPANLILDEEAGRVLDEQVGDSCASWRCPQMGRAYPDGLFPQSARCRGSRGHPDSGGASRFFFCAKASRAEKEAGLEGIEPRQRDDSRKEGNPGGDNPRNRGVKRVLCTHPTVKPVALMRYLCRLVTPPSGLILDPFLGSGTTGIAAILEGFQFAGCENNAEYAALAEARIARARQEGVLPMSVPEGREPEAELIAEVKPKEEM